MLLDALIMIVIAFPLIYYLAFRGLLRHIEERKRSEALLSRVLESLPVGVWITDQQGQDSAWQPGQPGNLGGRKVCWVRNSTASTRHGGRTAVSR